MRIFTQHSPTSAGAPSGAPAGRRQRGAVAVEFALLLPVVFVLSMGLIECGNIFRSWLTVQKAAQYACRFATTGQGELEGDRLARIKTEAEKITADLPGATDVSVRSWSGSTPSGSGQINNAGDPCGMVEVTVTYNYPPITPAFDLAGFLGLGGNAFNDGGGGTISLSSSDRKVNEPWRPCP